jgi:hypothetical protein
MTLQPLVPKFQSLEARHGRGLAGARQLDEWKDGECPGLRQRGRSGRLDQERLAGMACGAPDGQPRLTRPRTAEETPDRLTLSRQSAAAGRTERIVCQPDQISPGEKSQAGDPDDRKEKNSGIQVV